ncbi:MAG: TetR-like C-terminal domain-containing protein [Massilimicrobiota timonensis]
MDNEERNSYVKNEITKALLELLKEKDLKDIKINEITTKAQVGRVSFYRNYQDKEDILKQYLEKIIKEWKLQDQMPFELIMETLFEHLMAYQDFYTLLYQKDLFYLLRNTLKKLMVQDHQLSNPEAYAVAYTTYGIYGWIKEWIARGMQESPEDIYTFMEAQKTDKSKI